MPTILPRIYNNGNTVINFTDNATRARFNQIFNRKDAPTVLAAFKRLEAQMETQLGRKIKGIKVDLGTEFTDVVDYCIQKGIKVSNTGGRYELAKNGVAKRTNGLIHNIVRSMLIGGKVP